MKNNTGNIFPPFLSSLSLPYLYPPFTYHFIIHLLLLSFLFRCSLTCPSLFVWYNFFLFCYYSSSLPSIQLPIIIVLILLFPLNFFPVQYDFSLSVFLYYFPLFPFLPYNYFLSSFLSSPFYYLTSFSLYSLQRILSSHFFSCGAATHLQKKLKK